MYGQKVGDDHFKKYASLRQTELSDASQLGEIICNQPAYDQQAQDVVAAARNELEKFFEKMDMCR